MNIKVAILGVLTACGSYAMRPDLLKTEVEIRTGNRISDNAFRSTLKQLKGENKIAARRAGRNDVARYFIPGTAKAKSA